MPRLDIGKRPVNRRLTNGWQLLRCFLAPRAQLGIHALIAQRFSLDAICPTAREQIALNVDEARGQTRPKPSDEHLKIPMIVRSGSIASLWQHAGHFRSTLQLQAQRCTAPTDVMGQEAVCHFSNPALGSIGRAVRHHHSQTLTAAWMVRQCCARPSCETTNSFSGVSMS